MSDEKHCESKMDFFAILASLVHDMKNSIGMLLNTLDEIVMTCQEQQCTNSDLFPKIQYEAKRVNNNLIQLLTTYKIDNAQYPLNIAYQSVYEFLEEQIMLNKPLLDFKSINIDLECEEDLFWLFDSDLIAGVVNNVLNNAYRYTKDTILIKSYKEDDILVISMEDNGIGYPEEMLISESHKERGIDFKSGSTGLGLFFSSIVARMHKKNEKYGSISISNGGTFGGGCFIINIP